MAAHTPPFFTHTMRSTNDQISKHDVHQSCVLLAYITFSRNAGHFHWSNLALIDTLSGPHSKMLMSQLAHNEILKLQLIFEKRSCLT